MKSLTEQIKNRQKQSIIFSNQLWNSKDVDSKQFPDVFDPIRTGPGVWYSIHTSALGLTFDEFLDHMKSLSERFFCEKCKKRFF